MGTFLEESSFGRGGLDANFDVVRPKPLHGSRDGFFKLRVGDLRVVYSFDREAHLIQVHLIGNRNDIYKRGERRPQMR
jgi:mRNA interferase RelE/StbE